jgi:hypothetical protein
MSAPRKLHLEAEIATIADMSEVCDLLGGHFADQLIAMKQMNLTGLQATEQAERSSRLFLFVAGHLAFMARQLETRYLADLKDSPRAEVGGAS